MELLNKLGINWKLLLAQIVNFLILLFILYRFTYKPVLKMLESRTKKIEKGLKDSEAAGKKLAEIAERGKEVLKNAREEAQVIITKAEEQAKKNKDEIAVESKAQSEKIMSDTKKKIEEEKNKMMAEVKGEIAGLVIIATEKVISEKLNSRRDKELIEKAIK